MRQNDVQTHNARVLRQARTKAEAVLWQALRGRRVDGAKFRRQAPFGSCTVGFYCAARRLVIETTGSGLTPDHLRGLVQSGFRVLLVEDADILSDTPGVLNRIRQALR